MDLYWWLALSRLHNISETAFLVILLAFCIIALIILSVITEEKKEEGRKLFSRLIKYSTIIIFLNCLVYIFTPTKSDLATMFGWDALRSNDVKEIVQIVKQKLEKL